MLGALIVGTSWSPAHGPYGEDELLGDLDRTVGIARVEDDVGLVGGKEQAMLGERGRRRAVQQRGGRRRVGVALQHDVNASRLSPTDRSWDQRIDRRREVAEVP